MIARILLLVFTSVLLLLTAPADVASARCGDTTYAPHPQEAQHLDEPTPPPADNPFAPEQADPDCGRAARLGSWTAAIATAIAAAATLIARFFRGAVPAALPSFASWTKAHPQEGHSANAAASSTASAAARLRPVPQGLTAEQFREVAEMLRDAVDAVGGELLVHGSRAAYTARPDSDIDFAILVHKPRFDELIERYFGTPNSNSAKERTKLWAIKKGKIQAGEARLSRLRCQLESRLEMEVDLSVICRDGQFDQPPYIGVTDRG